MKFKTVLILALSFALNAHSAAPKAPPGGNPGYYRFMVGDIEINSISDGTAMLDVSQLLKNIDPKELDAILKKNFLSKDIELSVNSFLINTGTHLILVDAGLGQGAIPTTGRLIEHMNAAGYKPEQVDAVIITHMHGDHIGGLTANGKAVFPNATLYIDQADLNYWLDKKNAAKEDDPNIKLIFELAPLIIEPYKNAGKLRPITANMEIVPGIRSHATHGHTPGHQIYAVESKGQKLFILGDIVHIGPVQFEKPTARMMDLDSDIAAAEKARIVTFRTAAKERALIAAAHLSFPGVGHLRAEKKSFVFVPLNYTR